MAYYMGNDGNALINGNDFTVSAWSVRHPGTVLTYINSKSGNKPIRQVSIVDLTFTITIDLDPTAQPFSSSYNVQPGYAITAGKLQISKTNPFGWQITSGLVTDILQSLVVAGNVSTTLECAISGGMITPPGGTAY